MTAEVAIATDPLDREAEAERPKAENTCAVGESTPIVFTFEDAVDQAAPMPELIVRVGSQMLPPCRVTNTVSPLPAAAVPSGVTIVTVIAIQLVRLYANQRGNN